MTGFTPGPWVGFADQGKTIAIMPAMRAGDICEFSKPPTEADARLMIAAPDLLQALTMVRQELWVDYCLRMGRTDTDPAPFNARPHIRIIDDAVAKGAA
jgi:hypothetical protein